MSATVEETLTESTTEIAAMIPRYSWEVMDEEQKDALLAEVVLPRYMKTTSDGTQLGPSWWGEQVGATAESIRKRVQRLQASQNGSADARSRAVRESAKRHAKSVLKSATPEEIAELLDDKEIRANVGRAEAIHTKSREAAAKDRERETFGDEVVEGLESMEELNRLRMMLHNARGNLAGFVRHATDEGIENAPDEWIETSNEVVATIEADLGMVKIVLSGGKLDDDALAALLG